MKKIDKKKSKKTIDKKKVTKIIAISIALIFILTSLSSLISVIMFSMSI